MSLPTCFETHEEYFEECTKFLQEYQYLFNFANTEILVAKVLDQMNISNLENIDIFNENFNLENVKEDYLDNFFNKIKRLQVSYDKFEEDKNLEDIFDVPLSPKKKHEIIYLAREIRDVCEEVGCDTVVDFGSGLGYLDQLLHETTNYKVLGLECCESHYVGAKKRQRKYHENSLENVKYIRHRVSEQSHANIKLFLNDKFADYKEFCITGLHSCADLTIDAINIFFKMADAIALVLMPCCYHKMASNHNRFKHFPLSSSLRVVFDRLQGCEYLRVPFLRLGAQPPNGCKRLEDSVFNLMARAVLQQYTYQHNCKLKRNKRKAVKTKTMDNKFENYIQEATRGFTLVKNESYVDNDEVQMDLEELLILWRQIDPVTTKKAGIFILLQNYLQPVIENFILFDRLIFLRENSIQNCRYKIIFDQKLSPRCLALVARK